MATMSRSRTPDAADIKKVVIVRCGTVTHNFNPDQRHVTLEFKPGKGDVILARIPAEPNVAIIGYYLLFVIDFDRPAEHRPVHPDLQGKAPPAAVAGCGLAGLAA